MKKIIFTIFAFLFSSTVFAASTPSVYKVTVKAVQLKNSSGQWVTIAAPYQEVDIASVAADQAVASLLSDTVIPAGSYVNFRVVLSETMTVAGADNGYFTVPGGVMNISSTNTALTGSSADWPSLPANLGAFAAALNAVETVDCVNAAGPLGEITINLDLSNDADSDIYVQGIGDLAIGDAVVISGDSEVSMSFSFDLSGSVHIIDPTPGAVDSGDEVAAFLPPQEGTEFSITVDGVTAPPVTGSMMEMQF